MKFLGFNLTDNKNEQKRRLKVLVKTFQNINRDLKSATSEFKGLRDDTKNKTQKKEFYSKVKLIEKIISSNNRYIYKIENKLADLM